MEISQMSACLVKINIFFLIFVICMVRLSKVKQYIHAYIYMCVCMYVYVWVKSFKITKKIILKLIRLYITVLMLLGIIIY